MPENTQIHSSASVSPKAKIGEGVVVQPFAVIEDDVEIDDGSFIGYHAILANGTRIGKDCKIFPGAVLGTVPQDLKFEGETTTIEIGDRTVIREYATLNRGTNATGKTVIGEDCLLMSYVHVGHDCLIGNKVVISNTVQIAGHCEIGDHVVMGGMTGLHQFVRIGRHAMVGAMQKTVHDIPPFVMTAKDRFEGLNVIGLRRRGFENETIRQLRGAYRIIFQSGLLVKNAIEEVKKSCEMIPEIEEIVSFFEGSAKRKFIRPYSAH